MRLLHLDSSALGAASVSRQLTAEIVARQRALHPSIQVTYRYLAADPALHLTGAHMAVRAGLPNKDASIDADLVKGNAYLDDLLAADIVVIGAPMYNFSIPTPLKSWVDRIAVGGKTFQYTAAGPSGPADGQEDLRRLGTRQRVCGWHSGCGERAPGELPHRLVVIPRPDRREGRAR